MGKLKNLEKKSKINAEFDKKTPGDRVKSIKDEKIAKKTKIQKKSEGISKAKKADDVQKIKKKKKLKILTQIKQEVEANAQKIETEGLKDDKSKLVSREIVKKALIALKDGIKKEAEQNSSKSLFDDELRIGMRVVAIKIPDCPPHAKKITLAHSLHDVNPDICFFIRDSKVKKADQDETVREFQQKLDAAGVKCKKIMTVTQLKHDYNTHNLKSKLCNLYDVFLVEPSIAEHVYKILGKVFIKKRKRPHQILVEKESILKEMIDKAILKVALNVNPNSNLSAFEVGTVKMDNIKIADNIMTAIEQLKEKWPGGWRNINRLFLSPLSKSKVSIPIFYSNINPNEVAVPVIKGDKVGRLEKLSVELKNQAKKLKLDLKSKKIIRVREQKTHETVKPANEESVNTESKTDKILLPEESVGKKDKKRNKKKMSNELVNQEENAVVDEPLSKKKKKSDNIIKKEKSVLDEFPAKKNKKNIKSKEVEIDKQEEQADFEKEKNKIKKKSKDIVTDTIKNDNVSTSTSEKKQSPKKKKKDKKNKA
ncbi:hypothetical protein PVAND_008087 [Polypedilum vanderplanki]|uniref:Uncharacterized protein n=1 Tax=Polypedilum vanderplanki TaxID=319348 RepID=A0A9J6C8E0_POLVA|nr:hypothetical protein PVAND_008087 [Polypedilum vanderplanki]